MNVDDELEDRLFDCHLEEVEGRGPAPDLERRTLSALVRRDAQPRSGRPNRSTLVVAAVTLLALSIVTAIAAWDGFSTRDEGRIGRTSEQDRKLRSPESLIRELAEPVKSAAAARDLVRLGAKALPALTAALGDEAAPRGLILDVLHAMESRGAAALQSVAELIEATPKESDLLGPAFRAAATLAPFADRTARDAARRALLTTAFVDGGQGGGGGRTAVGGNVARHAFSLRQVGRLLHRIRIEKAATIRHKMGRLESDSPYERELAARWLADSADVLKRGDPKTRGVVVAALRRTLATTHPTDVSVEWAIDGFRGEYGYDQEHDRAIHLAASRSLVKIAGSEPAAAPGHAYLLQHGGPGEQRAAAVGLGRDGVLPKDRETVAAALSDAVQIDDPRVLSEVITTVGILGERRAVILDRLQELTRHEDRQVAARAVATLKLLRR